MAKEKFFFSKSYFDLLDTMDEENRMDYIRAVIVYGCYGKIDCNGNPVVEAIMANVKEWIDCSKIEYKRNQIRGQKGGRPVEVRKDKILQLRKEGFSIDEIALIMQCSTRTVYRKLKLEIQNIEKERRNANKKTNFRSIRYDIKKELRPNDNDNLTFIDGKGYEFSYIGKMK